MFVTRMDKNFFLIFILLLSIIYLLNFHKKRLNPDKNKEQIKYIDKLIPILEYICVGIILIGFLIYYGEKKYEYGKNFKFQRFILGKSSCKMNLLPTSYLNNLRHIF
jgi:hypothetical protein